MTPPLDLRPGSPRNPPYMHRRETVPPSFRPGEEARAYFFADPHGCAEELEKLVGHLAEQDGYLPGRDPAYFAGDLLLRGEEGVKTLKLAMHLGAGGTGAVLGNNDLTVLSVLYAMGHPLPDELAQLAERCHGIPEDTDRSRSWYAHVQAVAQQLADTLTPEELEWLGTRPLTAQISGLLPDREVVVVHAGLLPGMPVEAQDPYDLVMIRSVKEENGELLPSKKYEGAPWAEVYDQRVRGEGTPGPQEGSAPPYVVYGHDAKRGLGVSEEHSIRLDSGGVFGPSEPDGVSSGAVDLSQAASLHGARGRFSALRISRGEDGTVERKIFWVAAERAHQV